MNDAVMWTSCSCTGILVGPLSQCFSLRPVLLVGTLCSSFAFIISSFVYDVKVLIFTYGVIGGFGTGSIVLLSNVLMTQYFDRYRGLAFGKLSITELTIRYASVALGERLVPVEEYNLNLTESLCTGVTSSGSNVATFIFPNLMMVLVDLWSFQWMMFAFGCMLLPMVLIAYFLDDAPWISQPRATDTNGEPAKENGTEIYTVVLHSVSGVFLEN